MIKGNFNVEAIQKAFPKVIMEGKPEQKLQNLLNYSLEKNVSIDAVFKSSDKQTAS
jgi:hypothetical protein